MCVCSSNFRRRSLLYLRCCCFRILTPSVVVTSTYRQSFCCLFQRYRTPEEGNKGAVDKWSSNNHSGRSQNPKAQEKWICVYTHKEHMNYARSDFIWLFVKYNSRFVGWVFMRKLRILFCILCWNLENPSGLLPWLNLVSCYHHK